MYCFQGFANTQSVDMILNKIIVSYILLKNLIKKD